MEDWKAIPGYGNAYEASSLGRIRSKRRLSRHRSGRPMWRSERYLKGHTNPRGYVQVSLCVDGVTVTRNVHSLVASAFLGPRPPALVVRHLDGVGSNNEVRNLAYGTSQDNTDDMIRHGTVLRGELVPSAKLTSAEVLRIRELAPQYRRADLAKLFALSVNQLDNIVHRRSWKHVEPKHGKQP